jgi:hypothetical protein
MMREVVCGWKENPEAMCRKRRLPFVLVFLSVLIAGAIGGVQAFAIGETLRILAPRPPAVKGWGGPSDLGPVHELTAWIHEYASVPWGFDVVIEYVAMETVTTEWVLDQRMWGTLQDVAVVPLWLARELSERRLLVDLENAPRIDPGYFPCDPWDPATELPGWVRLLDISSVPYTNVTNPWACKEAIRIPGTGEYVIVLFEHDGIYENPERYICRRSAIIRNALDVLRQCIGSGTICCGNR